MKFIKRSYNYSTKNISLLSEKLYKMILLEKYELVIEHMRWKAHLYERNSYEATNQLHHIFKSRNCPPKHQGQIQFENDFIEFIKSVTFSKLHIKFQYTFQNDINSIKSRNRFLFANKTRNIYEADKDTYLKLLNDNITKTSRK